MDVGRIFIMFTFTGGLSLCVNSFMLYFHFGVTTDLKMEVAKSPITFPAITFCSDVSVVTKSAYKSFPVGFNEIFAKTESNVQEAVKTCQNSTRPVVNMMEYFTAMQSNDLTKSMNMVSLTYEKLILGCWWLKKNIKCNKELIVQHMTDLGNCFTINSGLELDGTRPLNGMHESLTTSSIGPQNIFRILLDLNQDEYCGKSLFYYKGAGLWLYIKDRNSNLFTFNLNMAYYRVPPGYHASIGFKLVKIVRKTEHLGRCYGKPITANDGTTVEYYKDFCYVKCFIEHVWAKCDCVMPVIDAYVNKVNFQDETMNLNKSCFSHASYLECVLALYSEPVKLSKNCTSCPLACSEDRFVLQTSFTKLAPSAFNRLNGSYYWYRKTYSNLSRDEEVKVYNSWFRKNVAMIDFYWITDAIEVWTDQQRFTFDDLVIYFGNVWFSFFGLSFLGLFELLYFICRRFIEMMCTNCGNNGKRTIPSVQIEIRESEKLKTD